MGVPTCGGAGTGGRGFVVSHAVAGVDAVLDSVLNGSLPPNSEVAPTGSARSPSTISDAALHALASLGMSARAEQVRGGYGCIRKCLCQRGTATSGCLTEPGFNVTTWAGSYAPGRHHTVI